MLNLFYEIENKLCVYLNRRYCLILHKLMSLLVNFTVTIYYKLMWRFFNKKGTNNNNRELIVSLTTFPSRINFVWICIETIMRQNYKPDRIILWLAKEQFEDESMLPSQLIKLKERGLEIRYCDDLKPHKKYYYTMLKNPNATVITLDDDILYPTFTIKKLVEYSYKYPGCIICNRGHIITFNGSSIAPYSSWKKTHNQIIEPSLLLCPTGVGGVLYPPESLDNSVFDKNNIIQHCLMADDLWLKVMSIRNSTKVAKTSSFPKNLYVISSSQKNSLSQTNVGENKNDSQLKQILSKYEIDKDKLIRS